jgi:hypothetical protein
VPSSSRQMAAMICVWSSPCSGVTSVMVNAILAEAATAGEGGAGRIDGDDRRR